MRVASASHLKFQSALSERYQHDQLLCILLQNILLVDKFCNDIN